MMSPMDLAAQLIETWEINNRVSLYLLDAIGEEGLETPLAKGKAVGDQFAHIHNVRLMWLKASAPDLLEGLEKVEKGSATLTGLKDALEGSGAAISKMIGDALVSGGRVKGFKPHVSAFVGYLISHEANHRGHAEIALRQAGRPLSDKASYGIWEWGVR